MDPSTVSTREVIECLLIFTIVALSILIQPNNKFAALLGVVGVIAIVLSLMIPELSCILFGAGAFVITAMCLYNHYTS